MYCSKCGKEINDNANFCKHCGFKTNIKQGIEEDITKIDTYIELVLEKDYCNCNELNTILGKHCDGSKNVAYAMQHILSDYKRVLKENEQLSTEVNSLKGKLDEIDKTNFPIIN